MVNCNSLFLKFYRLSGLAPIVLAFLDYLKHRQILDDSLDEQIPFVRAIPLCLFDHPRDDVSIGILATTFELILNGPYVMFRHRGRLRERCLLIRRKIVLIPTHLFPRIGPDALVLAGVGLQVVNQRYACSR
jgi:hypothetical protein